MICPQCQSVIDDEKNICEKCGWSLQREQLQQPITKRKPSAKSKKPKIKRKTILISIAAVLAFVLITLIARSIYQNSDEYKISKATELIVSGNYSEAVNLISDIYTPQAITIKAFVNVEYAKQAFINSASSDDFEKYKSAYYDFYNEISSFEEESKIFYLPDNLRQQYEQFRAALDFGNDYIEGDMLYENLRDAQMVMFNKVERKHSSEDGNKFTLKAQQERIDTSKNALSELSDYDFSCIKVDDYTVISLCYTTELPVGGPGEAAQSAIYLRNSLIETISFMISLCESEIKSSQEDINDSLEEFEANAQLYITYPDPDYTSYVGKGLQRISSEDDMYTNANIITHMIAMDITYYLLVGSTPYSYSY